MKYSTTIALSTIASASASSKYYCANIDPTVSDGAKGFFQMEYTSNNKATYTYHLDLLEFSGYSDTCYPNEGLAYHAHSFWTDSKTSSGGNSACGAPATGGHYDPFLACSGASQDIKDKCAILGRAGDNYPCNSDDFKSGNYALCEVGDFSGKYGALQPVSELVYNGTVNDEFAPLLANYKDVDTIANMWSSVVFHCKSDASRIVCGDLVESDGPC